MAKLENDCASKVAVKREGITLACWTVELFHQRLFRGVQNLKIFYTVDIEHLMYFKLK